jgi:hypothetical protein
MFTNDLVGRIRSEFLEMPGLHLSLTQAAKLWGLDERVCRAIVDSLVGTAFLRWTTAGLIARAD